LSILNQQKEPKGRLGRWQIQLNEFDFKLHYKPGKVIKNADAMSRIPLDRVNNIGVLDEAPDSDEEGEAQLDGSLAAPKIKVAQQKDEWCRQMISYLRRQELPMTNEKLAKRIVLEANRYLIRGDGILTYIPDPKVIAAPEMGIDPVIVLPEPLRKAALGLLHDHFSLGGHLGFQKTLRKVQARFFWPRMYTDVETYTKGCASCAKVKTPPIRRRAPHSTYERANSPLDCIEIDILGPIHPPSSDGSTVILVVTDLFTRYAEAYPLEHQRAPLIAKTLVNEFFSRYGCPKVIRSDQGKNFMSHIVKEVCKLYQVKRVVGSAYHPMSQGQVEKMNRTLIEMLKHYVQTDVFDWAEYIPHLVLAYNTSVHSSTLYTPYSLFYGRPARLPLDALIHKPGPNYRGVEGYKEEVAERLYVAHQNAKQNSEAALAAQKRYYDKRARKRDFRVGDRVYVTNENKKAKRRSKNDCRKFRLPWLGPCEIIGRKGEVTYLIRYLDSGKKEMVHENRLKLAYPRAHPADAPKAQTESETDGRILRSHNKTAQREQETKDWYGEAPKDESEGSDTDSSSDDDEEGDALTEEEGQDGLPSDDDMDDSEAETTVGNNELSNQSEDEVLEAGPSPECTGGVANAPRAAERPEISGEVRQMTDGTPPLQPRSPEGGTNKVDTEVGKELPPPTGRLGDATTARPPDKAPPRSETDTSLLAQGPDLEQIERTGHVKRKRGRPRINQPSPADAIPPDRKQTLQGRFNQVWAGKLKLEKAQGKLYDVDLYQVLGTERPDALEYNYVIGLKQAAERRQGPPQNSGVPPRRSSRQLEKGGLADKAACAVQVTTPPGPAFFYRGQVINGRYIRKSTPGL
jgi:hypothetical protein